MFALSRYDQLRVKTDNQLFGLLKNRLDRGVRDARLAAHSPSRDAKLLLAHARSTYDEVVRLIPLTTGMAYEQRALLESRLTELRQTLDEARPRQFAGVCIPR